MEKVLRRKQETGNMERQGRRITNMFEDIQKDIDAARAAGKLPPLKTEGPSVGGWNEGAKAAGTQQSGVERPKKWDVGAPSGGWSGSAAKGSGIGGNSIGGGAIGGVRQTGGQSRGSGSSLPRWSGTANAAGTAVGGGAALPRWGSGTSAGSRSTGAGTQTIPGMGRPEVITGEVRLPGIGNQRPRDARQGGIGRGRNHAIQYYERDGESGAWRPVNGGSLERMPYRPDQDQAEKHQRMPDKTAQDAAELLRISREQFDKAREERPAPPTDRRREMPWRWQENGENAPGREITSVFEEIQKDIDAAREAGKLPPLARGGEDNGARSGQRERPQRGRIVAPGQETSGAEGQNLPAWQESIIGQGTSAPEMPGLRRRREGNGGARIRADLPAWRQEDGLAAGNGQDPERIRALGERIPAEAGGIRSTTELAKGMAARAAEQGQPTRTLAAEQPVQVNGTAGFAHGWNAIHPDSGEEAKESQEPSQQELAPGGVAWDADPGEYDVYANADQEREALGEEMDDLLARLQVAEEAYEQDPSPENKAACDELWDQLCDRAPEYMELENLFTKDGAEAAQATADEQIEALNARKESLWADYPKQEMARFQMEAARGKDPEEILAQMEARGEDTSFYQRAQDIQQESQLIDRQIEAAQNTYDAAQTVIDEKAAQNEMLDRLDYDDADLEAMKQTLDERQAEVDANQKAYDETWERLMNCQPEEEEALREELRQREQELGASQKELDDIKAAYHEEEIKANKAKNTQDFVRRMGEYGELAQNADFAQYAGCTVADISAAEQQAQTDLEMAQWDSNDDPSKEADYMAAMEEHNHLLTLMRVAEYVTQDEMDTWNYLRQTQGPEAAQAYIDFMEESWNYRKGIATGESIGEIENPLLRALATGGYGVYAKLDSIGGGLDQLFSGGQSARRESQFASDQIMADLGEVGPEIFGKSLGQWGYTLTSDAAVGAMTAATGLAAPWLPAALAAVQTGASAGNLYRQALDAGYSEEDARMYTLTTTIANKAIGAVLGELGDSIQSTELAQSVTNGVAKALMDRAVETGMDILGEEAQKAVATRIREAIGGDGEEFHTPSDGEICEIVTEALKESERDAKLQDALAPMQEYQYYVGWDED